MQRLTNLAMNLTDPIRLDEAQPKMADITPWNYSDHKVFQRFASLTMDYSELTYKRRSSIGLSNLDAGKAMSLIRDTFRITLKHRDSSFRAVRKRFPGSGAVHAVSPLLIIPNEVQPIIYIDYEDRFSSLIVNYSQPYLEAISKIRDSYDEKLCSLVIFCGDLNLIRKKYQNPESLLLRDSGVALNQLSLDAVSRGISTRPVGLLCNDIVRMIRGDSKFVGLGGCFIGSEY